MSPGEAGAVVGEAEARDRGLRGNLARRSQEGTCLFLGIVVRSEEELECSVASIRTWPSLRGTHKVTMTE